MRELTTKGFFSALAADALRATKAVHTVPRPRQRHYVPVDDERSENHVTPTLSARPRGIRLQVRR